MKCNQCRRTLLSLQGTGSRCLGGRMGCSVLLSTVQGSCWTTNHWSLGGFPGQVLLCACPLHFHTQQLSMEAGIPGNLWHEFDGILKVAFCVLSSLCGREKRSCYLLWLEPRAADDNLSCCFFLPIPSVHLNSLSTVPGLYLNPSFLHEVNQTKLRGLLALNAFLNTDFKNLSGRISLCVILWQCLPPLSHFNSSSSLCTSLFSLL